MVIYDYINRAYPHGNSVVLFYLHFYTLLMEQFHNIAIPWWNNSVMNPDIIQYDPVLRPGFWSVFPYSDRPDQDMEKEVRTEQFIRYAAADDTW